MTLVTGVSTSEEFRNEIKERGQEVRIDATPLVLLRKMNAAGMEVSFTSPNTKIVSEANEEVNTAETIPVPRLSATIHVAFSTDSNYEEIQTILSTFESHTEIDEWENEVEVYESKPLVIVDESTGTEYKGTLYNEYGSIYFKYNNFSLAFITEVLYDLEGNETDVYELRAARTVVFEENDNPTVTCVIPNEGDYSKIEFTNGSRETVVAGELSLIENDFDVFSGKYNSFFNLPSDNELRYDGDYFNFQVSWLDASGFPVQDTYGLADGDVLTLETDFQETIK